MKPQHPAFPEALFASWARPSSCVWRSARECAAHKKGLLKRCSTSVMSVTWKALRCRFHLASVHEVKCAVTHCRRGSAEPVPSCGEWLGKPFKAVLWQYRSVLKTRVSVEPGTLLGLFHSDSLTCGQNNMRC